jgi:hypothetical protein
VHGSDFAEDTRDLAEIVLSQAGRTFLNYSPIGSEFEILTRLNEVGLTRRLFDPVSRELIISGSIVHQLFGAGKARDVDYFCSNNSAVQDTKFKGADSHHEFYRQVGINGEEVLSNPLLHFCFRGYLFTNPNYVSFVKLAYEEKYGGYHNTKNFGLEHKSSMRKLRRNAYMRRISYDLEAAKVKLYRSLPPRIRVLYRAMKSKLRERNRDFL